MVPKRGPKKKTTGKSAWHTTVHASKSNWFILANRKEKEKKASDYPFLDEF